MATTTRTGLVVNAAKALTLLLMTLTAFTTAACPYPVQYPLEPEEENEPPVVNSKYTDPYVVEESVTEQETPIFTIVVDEPNPGDDLQVKIIKNIQQTWLPTENQHYILLEDYIEPRDTLPPEDASNMGVSSSTRMAELELDRTPCAVGSGGQQVFLWVCVTDRSWDPPPPDYPNENPCIPRGGFVDTYPVIVNCFAP
jgi:hypothetical protein